MSAPQNLPAETMRKDLTISQVMLNGVYTHHEFCYIDPKDDHLWFGTITKRDREDTPTIQEIQDGLKLIDDTEIYLEQPASIIPAPPQIPGKTWIKRPNVSMLASLGTDFVTRTILHEANIMEMIPSHPNIVKYYGCSIHRGRITGIVLERLESTLSNWHPDQLNVSAFMADLQSAVDCLHSLGLAHNDINPYNIMMKDGRPILIDFGACAPPGQLVDFGGTPGWFEKPFFRSQKQHDLYALGKLRKWLENGRQM